MLDKDEEELEALFDEVEIPAHIREARMAAVHDAALFLQKGGFGTCDEVSEEREVLTQTAGERVCVVHFMHPEFRRCQIMQSHIDKLAHKHFRTKFLKFNITKGHWIAAKLKIRELPAVLCFVGGVVKDRVTGFEDFGQSDEFTTLQVEQRIARSGVIQLEDADLPEKRDKRLFGFKTADQHQTVESDSDDDWN